MTIDWRVGDAAATGLPESSYDAAVSNMGIIFVAPDAQVTELARLLRPGGALAFSSWVRDAVNPFFDPIIATLGAPPSRGHTPDQWGEQDTAAQRLSEYFDNVQFDAGKQLWQFESHFAAMRFVTAESPMHVDVFSRLDPEQATGLTTAFSDALAAHTGADGTVSFEASYVVITATRR